MIERVVLLAAVSARVVLGWGCEGHQAVAWIAEANLSASAAAQVKELLEAHPIDPALMRYCTQGSDDPMVSAATWADDARRTDGNAKWHYMDIPLQVSGGDIGKYCEPVGPRPERGERPGCVASAIAYNLGIVRDEAAAAADRAQALRYLIHFVGDVHQPLHTAENHDQGGNCDPVVLLDSPSISNLHSVWDSGLIEAEFRGRHMNSQRWAAALNRTYAKERAAWMNGDVSAWVWESAAIGVSTAYGGLNPPIPLQPENGRTDCIATQQRVYPLHIHLDQAYLDRAVPVIDVQIARAGFRLAKVLNEIWP